VCSSLGLPDPFLAIAGWAMIRCTSLLEIGDGLIGGAFWVPKFPWLILAATFALAIHFGGKRKMLICAGIFLLGFFSPLPRLGVLDVDQGDSIFFRTRAGEKIMMDMGPPGFHGREARSAQELGKIGVGSVDQIVLSHFDLDHRGGLDSFLRTHRVKGSLWFREEALDQKAAPKVLTAIERVNVPVRFLTPEKSPENIHCHFAPVDSSNDLSPLCIAQLPRRESIWLTGDMSSKAESWILAHEKNLPRADYLKVAHHGSRTSSSSAFLQASEARVALISVGAKNRYGHPTAETINRLEEMKMKIKRTDQEGSLLFY
jgi:competence protein ComEC